MPEEDFANVLKSMRTQFPGVPDVAAHPTAFLLDIHRRWKEAGGKLAGKPRHSDRFLEDQLKARGTPIRSLTPKLIGKTRIAPVDGKALASYLLFNWPASASDNEEVSYEPICLRRKS